jgi:CheY-like chemotaxis protein
VPHTLLIADDSTTIQRVVTLMFANEDINVVAVGDGDQAIDAIGRVSPDILLADVDMPGCSGYELAERVRSSTQGTRLPVLLLAGAFDPVDRERAIACGANGILTKPFDPAVLVARVKELLPGEAAPGQASAAQAVAVPPAPSSVVVPYAPSVPEAPTAPPNEAPARAEAHVARPLPEVDRYFEQLDAAFAALSQHPRPRPGIFAPASTDETPATADLAAEPEKSEAAPAAATSGTATPLPLADAFAALLAAEEAGFVPAGAAPAAATGAPASVDVDRLAEQVAERVLARLTDHALRDRVADIVATTAERLIREEIEQIRRNIK